MMETLIERVDIYLVLLVLVTVYMLTISDGRYFYRGGKPRAKNQSIAIGVAMIIITLGLYVVRQMWL